ncbi:MAG: anhydro-N-acetylmuramic acid kinase [Glaciecola sp.]|jgi:anhydro-N-acetylmuramic acid kinase
MLAHIEKLHTLAKADERLIIGLMSGTSLDGLDIALCKVSGHGKETKLVCKQFATKQYSNAFKKSVQQVFAKQNVSLDALCLLNAEIGILHGELVNQALNEWNVPKQNVDLIASHGQTIYHRPSSLHRNQNQLNSTLQIGDGDHIAAITGILTVSDFRQKHIAHGGEGAPLAMYGDYLLLSSAEEDRSLVNIGGIANITYIPSNSVFQDVICSDIGPGNTIMDALASRHTSLNYDKNASIAKQGNVNENLLSRLLSHAFLDLPLPKTTGPETFHIEWFESQLKDAKLLSMSVADQMATLNAFTANAIAKTINALPCETSVYISGGGAHNPLLVDNLYQLLSRPIHSTDQLGMNLDAKEAILFAVLANECVAGNQIAFQSNKQNQPNVSMGKISFPK